MVIDSTYIRNIINCHRTDKLNVEYTQQIAWVMIIKISLI